MFWSKSKQPQPGTKNADQTASTAAEEQHAAPNAAEQESGVSGPDGEQSGTVPGAVAEEGEGRLPRRGRNGSSHSSSSSSSSTSSRSSSCSSSSCSSNCSTCNSSTGDSHYADRGHERRHQWLGDKDEYSGSRMDGRLRIRNRDVRHSCCATCAISKTMGHPVKDFEKRDRESANEEPDVDAQAQSTSDINNRREPAVPNLNVTVMFIGSRSELKPFLQLGKLLHKTYGHRVRFATHPAFQDMIEKESGLEFFSVGGEPSELLEFMVNNPGAVSKLKHTRFGKVGKRHHVTADMFEGFWRSCTEASDGRLLEEDEELKPFIADCIIANPASYAHIHCAEALGIPLQIISTSPSTPTHLFSHPLSVLQKPHKRRSSEKQSYANFMSYPMVDRKIWQGLGCTINRFRASTLYLDRVSSLWASGAAYRLRVPHTYLWSAGLVPKPADWREEIDVSGFVFPETTVADFSPPGLLGGFLAAGETPIYIGFGSVVVGDGVRMTNMIFEAVKNAGVRALVSKNWEGLGDLEIPDYIHVIEDVPLDWIFARVKACVIPGDATTTALALKHGVPAMVIPFFEHQHFWGDMVSRSGAGPQPIAYRKLDSDRLAEGIMFSLTNEVKEAAARIGTLINRDGDGAVKAVKSVQSHMSLYGHRSTRCCIFPDELAVWQVKGSRGNLKLSPLAAEILSVNGYVGYQDLRLVRQMDWNDHRGSGDPVSGAVSSVGATIGGVTHGVCGRGRSKRRTAKKPSHKHMSERNKKKTKKSKSKERRRQQRRRESRDGAESTTASEDRTTASISTAEEVRRTYSTPTAERRRRRRSTAAAARDGPTRAEAAAERVRRTASTATTQERERPTTAASSAAAPDLPPRQDLTAHSAATPSRGKRAAWIMAKSPADFAYSSAQGLHNIPVLYGDRMVRKQARITGIRSGLAVSGREFGFGFYDGFTGLVTQPWHGAKTDGGFGFFKGVGKGLGGLVVKPISAVLSPIGYTMHGLTRQAERRCSPRDTLRYKRIAEGARRLEALSADERVLLQERIVKEWAIMKELQDELAKAVKQRGKLDVRKLDMSVLFADAQVAAQSTRLFREGRTIEEVIASAREFEVNPPSRDASS
ncbi:glycosyltransferase family 28 domain-containing protein [Ophiocordyceps camponoti-floridani]|uniref:Glycosyltransferase family 28 domain-containing protein n=1 Tax=Ophiocordyceps camponoti-floridani TaxID=2030778 RepID=A0A8H4VF92_9HYPO|nr:glycosyltransferase family 28 domain-containing protein [Ophiocordyceps camponoti-floridani]